MRICQLCNGFPPGLGGTETHNYTLVRYLMDRGYDVEVVAIRDRSLIGKDLTSEVTKDIKVHNLFLRRLVWRNQISGLIKGLKPFDIFDVHNSQSTIPIEGKIILSLHFFELTCPKKEWPIPCEYSQFKCLKCVNPVRYLYWSHIRKTAIRKSDTIMVKYESLKKLLIGSGVPGGKIFVVPHWIDARRINSLSKEKVDIEGINDGDFVFEFFGRASLEKGPFLLLEAFSKLAERYDNLKLVFLGNPFFKEKIRKFCMAKGISDMVFLLGAKPHNVVHKFLSIADCIVFPNKYFNYEWGLLEAMCTEKPIVATDVFATREILDEKNSVLVDVSSGSIMSGMEEVMNDKRAAKRKASNALRKIKEKHSMSNLKMYEELLERFK